LTSVAVALLSALLWAIAMAIPFSYLWLHERPNRWTMAGTLLTTAGIVLVA
jgi:drug/metabolite transporter (DMT)-like permease